MPVARSRQTLREGSLLRAIRDLSSDQLAEVEEFVEFLSQREDRQLTQAATKVAERAFRRAWDNRADTAYDRL